MGHGEGHGRTIVFTANIAAADEAAAALAEVGLEPLLYHREVSPQDRAAALEALRTRCLPSFHISSQCLSLHVSVRQVMDGPLILPSVRVLHAVVSIA